MIHSTTKVPVLAVVLLARAAQADMITLTTNDTFVPSGLPTHGWWAEGTGNSNTNRNYLVGTTATGTPGIGGEHRNFFSFDISAILGPITSATLVLPRGKSSPLNEATETIGLFDVTTDVDSLNFNQGINLAIFDDLGTGTSYGEFTVLGFVPGLGSATGALELGLNAAALAEMNLHLNQFFSIGGRLLSNDGFDGIFGESHDLQPLLEVEYVPEPSTALLLAAGLTALAVRRRVA